MGVNPLGAEEVDAWAYLEGARGPPPITQDIFVPFNSLIYRKVWILWVPLPDMQKNRIFWALPQTPLGSLQHSSLAGGRRLAIPSPKTHSLMLSVIRVSPVWDPWMRFTVHTPWEKFLDKSPLGICLLLTRPTAIAKWSWVRAIGRRLRHTESQYCPAPDDVLSIFAKKARQLNFVL